MSSIVFAGFLVSVIFAISGQVRADYCCSFEDASLCGWTAIPNGPLIYDNYEWNGSGGGNPPPIVYPDILIHDGYLWLQDFHLSGYDNATIRSPAFTINHKDIITIDVYRHITFYEGGARPVFYYVDTDSLRYEPLDLEWDPGWTIKTFQCGDSHICCVEYPCNGYFEVVGIIYDKFELLAIDNVQVNSFCTGSLTTTPTKISTTSPSV